MGVSLLFFFDEKRDMVDGNEISCFPCNIRPVVGEIWYIPLGYYPYDDEGRLKDDACKSAKVRVKEVMVTPYSSRMPKTTMTLAKCEIIDEGEHFYPNSFRLWV